MTTIKIKRPPGVKKGTPSPLKGRPSPLLGRPSPIRGVLRPHIWKYGQDPAIKAIHYKFLRARVQARYWCQPWEITFEDYLDLLRDVPHGGTGRQSWNLCRRDTRGAWSKDNMVMMQRGDAVQRNYRRTEDGQRYRRTRREVVRPRIKK